MTADFLTDTIETRRYWNKIIKMLKERKKQTKPCQLKILYSVKISFKNAGKIKTFSDNENTKKVCCQ